MVTFVYFFVTDKDGMQKSPINLYILDIDDEESASHVALQIYVLSVCALS